MRDFFSIRVRARILDWAAAAAADFWAEKVISIWADNFFWAGPGRSTTVHHVAHFEPIFQRRSSVFFFARVRHEVVLTTTFFRISPFN